MNIELIPVASSQIAAIGWDKEKQELYIEFHSRKEGVPNSRYIYHNVPYALYQELMASESKGSFFYKNIKGVYAFTRYHGTVVEKTKGEQDA